MASATNRFSKIVDYRKLFGWRFWLRWRATAVRAEYENYRRLQALGLPCPADVRFEQHRNLLGLLNYAALSMARVENATDLRYIMCFNEYAELRADRGFRRALTLELARQVRRMHGQEFFHGSLTFRQVLVRRDQPTAPQVFFIGLTDCQLQPPPTERQALLVRDLAGLWWDARKWCTKAEVALFLQEYTGQRPLAAATHALARQIGTRAREIWSTAVAMPSLDNLSRVQP